ncbi:chorismate mutase [Kineosporia sp. J2-2]|uniref:chorismate mutase n=1 Tax=Kineosporia corallincola TaxID=2835133 RepID=A0ABS5TN55_9ACTN|nr:chorismate mutase [Kineosporia corallincola]MBT0772537.1 chorismate mutase [Kineosporia corallincola]
MAVRAIRGATQVDVDEREHVLARTRELVADVMESNKLDQDSVISIIFTATQDVTSVAPAVAARQLGLNDPALICVQEMHVEGAMPRLVRLVAHVDTDLERDQIQNRYLRGTHTLRAGIPSVPED